ncbi:MAG: DNA-protecting protein DprA [Lachnospiraceae bacterium]|nr:DNA-protecting protein DprA [Lachnospiraceae bacterium]
MQNQIVLALMQLGGIGRKTILRKIPAYAGMDCTPETLSSVLEEARALHRGIPEFGAAALTDALLKAERVTLECRRLGIRIVTYLDEEYPKLLWRSADPPALLYVLGDISFLDEMNTVAIIGTREPSSFGMRTAEKMGRAFAECGFADVSGLAAGCDTGGHRGCLAVGGKTAAILPCGIDRIYPPENRGLAKEIAEKGGALISEYPPGTEAFQGAFVERDRLQAALSDGLLVIETGLSGGTHFTVRFAEDYGRIVGCVRHPEAFAKIPEAAGNRMFLSQGRAIPVGDEEEFAAFCSSLRKKRQELREDGAGYEDAAGPGNAFGQKKAAGTEAYRQLTIEDFMRGDT